MKTWNSTLSKYNFFGLLEFIIRLDGAEKWKYAVAFAEWRVTVSLVVKTPVCQSRRMVLGRRCDASTVCEKCENGGIARRRQRRRVGLASGCG